MKFNLVVFCIFSVCLWGTTVEEIIQLRESGFSESEIVELVDQKDEFEAKDYIELKKNDFSTKFILEIREKKKKSDLPQIVQMIQPIQNQEKKLEEEIISKARKWNATVRKVDAIIERALKISPQYELWMNSASVDRETSEKKSKFADIIGDAKNVATELPIFDLDVFPKDRYDAKILPSIVDDIESSFEFNLTYRKLSWVNNFLIRDLREGDELRKTAVKFWDEAYDSSYLIDKLIINESEAISFIPKNGSYEEVKRGITYKGTWENSKNVGKRLGFYDSGEKEGEDNWIDGVKTGLEQRWYKNGNEKYLASWNESGAKVGTEKEWYENGDIKYEMSRDNSGLKNGLETYYYQGGAIKSQVIWQLGEKNGEQKSFAENGQLISSYVFEKNNLLEIKNYRSNGSIKIILTTDSGTRRKTLIKFDENNNSVSSFQFLNEVEIKKPNVSKKSDTFTEVNGSFRESSELSSSQLENSKKKDLRYTFEILSPLGYLNGVPYFGAQKSISHVLDGNVKYKDKDLLTTYEGKFAGGIPLGLHKLNFDNGDSFNLYFERNGDVKCVAVVTNGDTKAIMDGYLINTDSFVGKLRIETTSGHQVHLYNEKPLETDYYSTDERKIHSVSYSGTNYGQVGSRVYYNSKGEEECFIKLNDRAALDGICRISSDDGKLLSSSSYENGLRSGRSFIYHKNGGKAVEMNYQFNRLEG